MTKRVVVQMSDDCHKALKAYATFYEMTMSEVLYSCTRMQLHSQLDACEFVGGMFEKLSIVPDKRAGKPCFSYMCFSCKHATACRAGIYEGVAELAGPCIDHNLVTENGKAKLTDMQQAAGQPRQFEPKIPIPQATTVGDMHHPRMKYISVKNARHLKERITS